MRFADILSRDINCEGRNLAYKIISILYPFYKGDEYYKFISNSVMTKLGNFPSLGLIMEKDDARRYDTTELLLDKQLKEYIKRFLEQKKYLQMHSIGCLKQLKIVIILVFRDLLLLGSHL